MEILAKTPRVSVCVVTYNQEKFIGKCLQSILDQETDFAYEILVGDDCSTDGTRSIVEGFSKDYPEIVKPIFHKKNIGAFENYISVHKMASGKFVAHIDGDDFFASNKLQIQSIYLDENSNCSAVVHKLDKCDQHGTILPGTWPDRFSKEFYSLDDVVVSHPEFGHSSLMYRNGLLSAFLDCAPARFIDFQIYVHLAAQGPIGAIDRSLGCYTCGIGISSSSNLYQLADQALVYAKKLGLREAVFRHAMARQYFLFAKKALVENDRALFASLIRLSFGYKGISLQQRALYIFRNNALLFATLLLAVRLRSRIRIIAD